MKIFLAFAVALALALIEILFHGSVMAFYMVLTFPILALCAFFYLIFGRKGRNKWLISLLLATPFLMTFGLGLAGFGSQLNYVSAYAEFKWRKSEFDSDIEKNRVSSSKSEVLNWRSLKTRSFNVGRVFIYSETHIPNSTNYFLEWDGNINGGIESLGNNFYIFTPYAN